MKFPTSLLIKAAVLVAPAVVDAWNFEIFDEDCVTSTDLATGAGDQGCTDTPNPHECFRISNMGTCELYLFASADDCENGEAQQFYDNTNEDMDISPMFAWDSYFVDC